MYMGLMMIGRPKYIKQSHCRLSLLTFRLKWLLKNKHTQIAGY